MGTSLYKAFATYIMQGNFTLLLPATVSTVETVMVDLYPHNMPVIISDEPIHSTRLSCRISPSRPEILSLFLCAFLLLSGAAVSDGNSQTCVQKVLRSTCMC